MRFAAISQQCQYFEFLHPLSQLKHTHTGLRLLAIQKQHRGVKLRRNVDLVPPLSGRELACAKALYGGGTVRKNKLTSSDGNNFGSFDTKEDGLWKMTESQFGLGFHLLTVTGITRHMLYMNKILEPDNAVRKNTILKNGGNRFRKCTRRILKFPIRDSSLVYISIICLTETTREPRHRLRFENLASAEGICFLLRHMGCGRQRFTISPAE